MQTNFGGRAIRIAVGITLILLLAGSAGAAGNGYDGNFILFFLIDTFICVYALCNLLLRAGSSGVDRSLGMGEASGSNPDRSMFIGDLSVDKFSFK